MTERDVFNVSELKLQILRTAGNRCEVCGAPIGPHNTQLAHRIPQSNANLKKYGPEIVHHRYNLAATCSLECNGKVIVHGAEEDHLVREIKNDLDQEELYDDIYADQRLDGLW